MKRLLLLLVPALVLACDENPETPALGTVGITTSAPTVEQGFTTTDGWAVTYSKFLVNLSAVTIAGSDEVLTASATAQIVDYATPPTPKTLLTSTNRVARAWENVGLEIAPATADSTVIDPATSADQDLMIAGKFSIYVEGTMTKGTTVKSLKWGFTPDTKYDACTGRVGDAEPFPGLLVPANGSDSANIALTGDVFFFDNPAPRGHSLRGDPIAAADSNNDGAVTMEELTFVSLDDARMGLALYQAAPEIDSLAAFITDQSRSLVAAFRDEGSCTITPVVAAP